MRQRLYILLFCLPLYFGRAAAQIPDGSTAPDFTFTDISGNIQNLYSNLNQGKYVAIDISATWCSPCWNYHNGGVMDSIYQAHDMPGTGDWKVMFIEADGGTDSADLYGTGNNTQGNWVQGEGYTIMDPTGSALNSFKNAYAISFYPTFYMICPNKKVYRDTLYNILAPRVSTWEYVANTLCAATGIDNMEDSKPVTIFPNPALGSTTIYFALNSTSTISVEVLNIIGQVVDVKNYGVLKPGDQSLRYEVSNLQRGLYYFKISGNFSRSVIKKVIVQ